MIIPCFVPSPIPAITAVGVASPKAHGQAITSTEIAANKAMVSSGISMISQGIRNGNIAKIRTCSSGKIKCVKKDIIAITITIGTNTPVTLSAKACMGTFVF
jgi:hypothetical protein